MFAHIKLSHKHNKLKHSNLLKNVILSIVLYTLDSSPLILIVPYLK